MFSFFSKQKPAFGLDISSSTLRIMQLERTDNGFFPSAFSDAKLPKGLVSEERIQNPEGLAKILRHHLKQPVFGRFAGQYVVFSVPEAKSFVRVIRVPKMSEEDAQEAVPFEAEQYIPLPIEQVYLDFKILSNSSEDSASDKMQVVIVAAPKTIVDSYIDVINQVKLKPVAAEVESEAIVRALISEQDQKEATLVVDLSAAHTSLVIFDKGMLRFTSSLPIAGNSLTSQISQKLTINFEEAEKLKLQVGLHARKDKGRVRSILLPQLESIVEAINNTVNFYKEHSEGQRQIGRILLCGGGSRLKGLVEYLNQELPKRNAMFSSKVVRIGDPWVNVLGRPVKKVPPLSKFDSLTFTTAIGLALRGVQMEEE